MKGRIYKIYSKELDKIYIGSTNLTINKRFRLHKEKYKCYLEGTYPYTSSFEIMKYNDCKVELLEDIIYNDKKELLRKEKEYILKNNCVNLIMPIRN